MNQVCIIGRLTKDVELKYGANNTAVSKFTLAVNRKFKSDGQPEADFINIVTFGKSAEFCAKYFNKGQQVGITGRIQTRNWEDTEGKRHYATEVIADSCYFADGKREGQAQRPEQNTNDGFYPADIDNDLPF